MTTKKEPLLSDGGLREMRNDRSTISSYPIHAWMDGAMDVRDLYEAARVKDAELIQMLVNALRPLHGTLSQTVFYDSFPTYVLLIDAALEAAAAAGFTPSEP